MPLLFRLGVSLPLLTSRFKVLCDIMTVTVVGSRGVRVALFIKIPTVLNLHLLINISFDDYGLLI